MDVEFSSQERELYEQRLREGLENGNNTNLLDCVNDIATNSSGSLLGCVDDMATNSQASGTQAAYKGAQNRLRNYLKKE